MATGYEGLTNPKRTIARREDEAEKPDPKKGVDKGDLPGPAVDFFKPREKKAGPPAELLKKHQEK